MAKIYIDNEKYMEFIDDIATQMTEEKFKEDCYYWYGKDEHKMTDEAQDFYNERYDQIETLLINTLNIHSNNELINDN